MTCPTGLLSPNLDPSSYNSPVVHNHSLFYSISYSLHSLIPSEIYFKRLSLISISIALYLLDSSLGPVSFFTLFHQNGDHRAGSSFFSKLAGLKSSRVCKLPPPVCAEVSRSSLTDLDVSRLHSFSPTVHRHSLPNIDSILQHAFHFVHFIQSLLEKRELWQLTNLGQIKSQHRAILPPSLRSPVRPAV